MSNCGSDAWISKCTIRFAPETSLSPRQTETDIAVTWRALDESDRPAVLVEHSYGGAVITGARVHPQVAYLLYLAAFQLAEGESVCAIVGPPVWSVPTTLWCPLIWSERWRPGRPPGTNGPVGKTQR